MSQAEATRKPQLHFSGLDKLWTCGEQFRRIYIEMERPTRGTYMAVGSGVDAAVNRNLENKILTGELLSVQEIKDVARDSAEIQWKVGDISLDADEVKLGLKQARADSIDKAVRLAELHAKDIAPNLKPTHVQRPWALELNGFPFDIVGTIDVQEGTESVRDTKTSGKSPNKDIADMSDQMTMYSLAIRTIDGVAPKAVALDYLIDNKTPVAKTFTSDRSDDDFRTLLYRLENAAEVIQKQAFTPARPTDWVCSAKWCNFHSSCRYAKNPKSIFTGEING